jgi:methyl-accepting chemotaxis protein
MSIKHRFFFLVMAFAALALGIVMVSLTTMREYDDIMKDYRTAYENTLNGERLNRLVSTAVMESRGIYMSKTPDEARPFADNLNASLGQIDALMHNWQADQQLSSEALSPKLIANVKGFVSLRRQLAQHSRDNRLHTATQLSLQSRNDRKALQDDVDRLTANMKAHLIMTQTSLETYKADRKRDFILIAVAGIAIMVFACILMVRRYIHEPLQQLASSIIRISEGDYDAQIPTMKADNDLSHVWNAIRVLKDRSIEVERLHREQHEAEMKMRELTLD